MRIEDGHVGRIRHAIKHKKDPIKTSESDQIALQCQQKDEATHTDPGTEKHFEIVIIEQFAYRRNKDVADRACEKIPGCQESKYPLICVTRGHKSLHSTVTLAYLTQLA